MRIPRERAPVPSTRCRISCRGSCSSSCSPACWPDADARMARPRRTAGEPPALRVARFQWTRGSSCRSCRSSCRSRRSGRSGRRLRSPTPRRGCRASVRCAVVVALVFAAVDVPAQPASGHRGGSVSPGGALGSGAQPRDAVLLDRLPVGSRSTASAAGVPLPRVGPVTGSAGGGAARRRPVSGSTAASSSSIDRA